jgi:hypothetical protein
LAGSTVGAFAGATLVLDEANLRCIAIAGHRAFGQRAALVRADHRTAGARGRACKEEQKASHWRGP